MIHVKVEEIQVLVMSLMTSDVGQAYLLVEACSAFNKENYL